MCVRVWGCVAVSLYMWFQCGRTKQCRWGSTFSKLKWLVVIANDSHMNVICKYVYVSGVAKHNNANTIDGERIYTRVVYKYIYVICRYLFVSHYFLSFACVFRMTHKILLLWAYTATQYNRHIRTHIYLSRCDYY